MTAFDDIGFVLSAPVDVADCPASIMQVDGPPASQMLLGTAAQRRAMAAILAAMPVRACFVPRPELFSAPESLAPLRAFLRSPTVSRGLVHLRCGSLAQARMLKAATNVLVLPGGLRRRTLALGGHPFADGVTAPHATDLILSADPDCHVVRPDGQPIRGATLPPSLLVADLVSESSTRKPSDAGLLQMAFATVGLGQRWQPLADSHCDQGERPVAIPCDFSEPGALALALLRHATTAADAPPLVLLPFDDACEPESWSRLVEAVITAADPQRLPRITVARAVDTEGACLLARWCRVAVIDGEDSHAVLTRARLHHLGMICVTVQSAGNRRHGWAPEFAFDERRTLEIQDRRGRRAVVVGDLSADSCRKLLSLSRLLQEQMGEPVMAALDRPCPEALMALLSGTASHATGSA